MRERRSTGFVRQAAVVQLQAEIVMTLRVPLQQLKRFRNRLKRKNGSVIKVLIQIQHEKANIGPHVENAIAVLKFDTMLVIDIAFKLALQCCQVAFGRIIDIHPVGQRAFLMFHYGCSAYNQTQSPRSTRSIGA